MFDLFCKPQYVTYTAHKNTDYTFSTTPKDALTDSESDELFPKDALTDSESDELSRAEGWLGSWHSYINMYIYVGRQTCAWLKTDRHVHG